MATRVSDRGLPNQLLFLGSRGLLYAGRVTGEALKDRLNEQPFRGFGLRMPDGRLLPVPHPEFISIEPDEERIAVVWKGSGGYWTMDLELVSDLEPLDNQGRKRRR